MVDLDLDKYVQAEPEQKRGQITQELIQKCKDMGSSMIVQTSKLNY